MTTKGERFPSSLPEQTWKTLTWFDLRKRRLGLVAFVLNRITALGLVLYLAIHLVVLSLLAFGESAWDTFVAIARSPAVLMLDIVLIAGILIHGLNGLRLSLVGLGVGDHYQEIMFVVLMLVALVILVVASIGMLTI